MFFPWNILQPLLLGNITSLHIVDCRAKMFFCLCPARQFWLFKAGFPLIKKGRVLPPLLPPPRPQTGPLLASVLLVLFLYEGLSPFTTPPSQIR